MCTAFRDGFQSAYGARVLTADFLPALEAAADAGIRWFEMGGGARFQSLYFYCDEDAFAMMDACRRVAGPDAELQTLSRGVNVVGLESQSSDVIDLHAKLFKKHGVSMIRNFDALNDVNNLIYSGRRIAAHGLKHQVCVTMMALPPGVSGAHDAAFYVKTLQDILDSGLPFDSVCFKDASGTATPSTVYETIKGARKILPPETLVQYHTHETAGIGVAQHLAALKAGADALDLSLAPVSGGTCQTDVITMWHALRGSDYTLDVDIDKVIEAERVFKDCMKDYFMPPEATMVEPMIPFSPMPGGALTANTQMLRDNNIMDRYSEIIEAMAEVVRRGGFGTSVTPVSQFYFQQAFNNVMFGPWKKIADGYGKMVLGYFGRTPLPPDVEIVAIAAEQLGLSPTERTPLEINDADPAKGLEPARALLRDAGLPESDENLFIAATCKEKGIVFLRGDAKVMVRKNAPGRQTRDNLPAVTGTAVPCVIEDGPVEYHVSVGTSVFTVRLDGENAEVNGRAFTVSTAGQPHSVVGQEAQPPNGGAPVEAPMPGVVLRLTAKPGDRVRSGQALVIIEAMKMEVEVTASVNGVLGAFTVAQGDQVAGGQALAYIN